jgi:hypothetical protein
VPRWLSGIHTRCVNPAASSAATTDAGASMVSGEW